MTARIQLSSLRERIAAWLCDLNSAITEANTVFRRRRAIRANTKRMADRVPF
jgi:hypothetical protein